jgi:hypothetical protein
MVDAVESLRVPATAEPSSHFPETSSPQWLAAARLDTLERDDQASEPDEAAPRPRSSGPGQATMRVAITWARCASKAFKSGETGATVVMNASLRPRAKRMKSDAMVTVVPSTVTAVSTR